MVFGRYSFSHAHRIRQEHSPDERVMQDIHEHYDVETQGSERKSRAIEKTSWDIRVWPHKPVSAPDRDFGPAVEEWRDQSLRRAKFCTAGRPQQMLDLASGHRRRMRGHAPCRESLI